MSYWDYYDINELEIFRKILLNDLNNLDLQHDIIIGILQDIDDSIEGRKV